MAFLKRHQIWLGLLAPVMVVCFQNCGNVSFHEDKVAGESKATGGGNGDGYGGKLTVYHHIDSSNPCSQLGPNGVPRPNDTIFLYGLEHGQLVREHCQDIRPRDLADSEYSLLNNRVSFAGRSFYEHAPRDFEAIAALCPAGLRPRASAVRENWLDSAVNLADAEFWGSQGGIGVGVRGSFLAVPAFLLTRTEDASVQSNLRLDQFILLDRNTQYSFSFLARRGSSNSVRLMMYDRSPALMDTQVTWDLTNGLVLSSTNTGLLQVSTTSRVAGDGYFLTVYFTTPSNVRGLDIGFAAADPSVGSSISVATPQVEVVSNYCTP